MKKDYIDRFFDSMSDDVLKEKWEKYEALSESTDSVKISDFVNVWNNYYNHTFSIDIINFDIKQNITLEKSEIIFGLFL